MTPREKAEIAIQDIREHLANCRQSPVDPNLILADRRDFANHIDRVEKVLQEVLDEYESILEQRGELERAARRESDQIISSAESRADDVYAASIVYTDNMIGTLQTIIDDTNDSLNGVIRRFRKEMRRQKDLLKKNEIELQAELLQLKDNKKYLQLLEEINAEREEKRLAGKQPEEEKTAPQPKAEAVVPPVAEKADVQVNTDAAYFKWKEAQEGGVPEEEPQAEQKAAAQPEQSAAAEPDDKTRFADVEEQETWQMERKGDGDIDLQHTRIFRPVSREQVRMDHKESTIDTAKLPDEEALMRAMLQGEEDPLTDLSPKAEREFVDDADNFEYYDDDLGDLDGLEELDDFDDFDDFDDEFPEDDDFESGAVGKQVAGKIKDFLLGK